MIRSLYDLDKFALDYARNHPDSAIVCDYPINEAPQLANPALVDVVPLYHQADGIGYQVALSALATVIGGSGTSILASTSFGPLVYNYGYYVFLQSPSTGVVANTAAMNAMMTATANATPFNNGGEIWIPFGGYALNFQSSGFAVTNQTVWRGLGVGGTGQGEQGGAPSAYHFTFNGDGTGFNCAGAHTSGGTRFENLAIQNTNATLASTVCIDANQWNVRAVGCNFVNWPCSYNAGGVPSGVGSGAGLSAGLEKCTIQYLNGPNGTASSISPVNHCLVPPTPLNDTTVKFCPTMVVLSAPQTYSVGPGEYFQTPPGSPNNGPTNTVGVAIGGTGGGPVEHAVIRDNHISNFYWGISYCFNQSSTNGSGAAGAKGSTISSVECQSWASCVFMMNPGVNSDIFGEKFYGCVFQKTQNSTDASSIIYIDGTTNGAAASSVDDIEFNNCTVYSDTSSPQANQYGYQFFSCGHIRIIGGQVANCGNGSASANIAITGVMGGLLVSGTRIGATYANAKNNTNTSAYGVLISGNQSGSDILFENCDMQGTFGTNTIKISGNLSNTALVRFDNCPMSTTNTLSVTGTVGSSGAGTGALWITNCNGYNDQNTSINTVGNISTGTAYAAYNQGSNSGTNYYGPSFMMFTANASGGTFQFNGGSAQTLVASQIVCLYLSSPYDTVQFNTHAPAAIQWIGK